MLRGPMETSLLLADLRSGKMLTFASPENSLEVCNVLNCKQVIEISDKPPNADAQNALQHYQSAAQLILKGRPEFLPKFIKGLVNSAKSNYFFLLCRPSWSGKTQLIYGLDNFARHPVPGDAPRLDRSKLPFDCVFHFVVDVDSLTDSSQEIYHAQSSISRALMTALDSDGKQIIPFIASKVYEANWSLNFSNLMSMVRVSEAEAKNLDAKALNKYLKKKITRELSLSATFIEIYSKLNGWKVLSFLKSLIIRRHSVVDSNFDENIQNQATLLDEFNEFVLAAQPVIVCLDEFNLSGKTHHEVHKMVLLRNLLRKTNAVPIVLGTNTRVSNLLLPYSANFSCSRDQHKAWCKILTKLPLLTKSSLSLYSNHEKMPPQLQELIMKSPFRPGTTKEFVMQLHEHQVCSITDPLEYSRNLKMAAEKTFLALLEIKTSLSEVSSLLGYYAMLFSNFRLQPEVYDWPAFLIDRHLAHMVSSKSTHLASLPDILSIVKTTKYLSVRNLTCRLEPVSIYINLKDDELNQFIVFSGMAAFAEKNPARPVSFKIALESDKNFCTKPAKENVLCVASSGLEDLNIFGFTFRLIVEFLWDGRKLGSEHIAGRAKRDGNKMECLSKGATVKASVAGGPSGQSFQAFLLRYAEEFQLIRSDPFKWDNESLELLGNLKDQFIPYLLAVGYSPLGTFSSLPGFFTGYLEEVKDSARLDSVLSPCWIYDHDKRYATSTTHQMFITKEEKNYQDKFDGSNLTPALSRAALDGRSYHQRWREKFGYAPNYHVHIITVSSVTDFQISTLVDSYFEFHNYLELYKMKFDSKTNTLGLEDLFDHALKHIEAHLKCLVPEKEKKCKICSVGIQSSTSPISISEDFAALEIGNDAAGTATSLPEPSTGDKRQSAESSGPSKKPRKFIKATEDFPRSKVIIIPIEQLFGYSFSSAENNQARL